LAVLHPVIDAVFLVLEALIDFVGADLLGEGGDGQHHQGAR
jgi:hypothetical protein